MRDLQALAERPISFAAVVLAHLKTQETQHDAEAPRTRGGAVERATLDDLRRLIE